MQREVWESAAPLPDFQLLQFSHNRATVCPEEACTIWVGGVVVTDAVWIWEHEREDAKGAVGKGEGAGFPPTSDKYANIQPTDSTWEVLCYLNDLFLPSLACRMQTDRLRSTQQHVRHELLFYKLTALSLFKQAVLDLDRAVRWGIG